MNALPARDIPTIRAAPASTSAVGASIVHDAYLGFGPANPLSPIVYAVPHAGRDYAAALLAQARVEAAILARLEDRFADRLADGLIMAGATVFIARTPRALIDLNRDERAFDPGMIADLPHGIQPQACAKARGGIGLVPRRIAGSAELWRAPLPYAELARRIETVHRPYHAALADALTAARARFGTALLIDLHSMPPLGERHGDRPPDIVLGDRFGRSAAARITALVADVARSHGYHPAINTPYPGNYTLDRHGQPDRGIHALQIEVDRTVYLDSRLDSVVDTGLAGLHRCLAALDHQLQLELLDGNALQAAE